MKNSVTVSGVLFALEDIRSPGKYVQATFINPEQIHIIRSEGNCIYFRVTKDIEVEDTTPMKDIASTIIIDSSVNVIWEFCVQYKSEVPDYAPVA